MEHATEYGRMTASTGEFGVVTGEVSTDELLQERMATHLGREAAELFFARLRTEENLTRRAQHLVRAAELLEIFSESSGSSVPKMEIVTTETPLELSPKDTAVSAAKLSPEGIPPPDYNPEVISSHEVRGVLVSPTEQTASVETERGFAVDARIGILLDELGGEGTVGRLELAECDKEVVVDALMAIRGKLGPRGIPSTFVDMLNGMYDGKEQLVIADSLGITPAALAQKWLGFRKRCIENARTEINALTVITDTVRPKTANESEPVKEHETANHKDSVEEVSRVVEEEDLPTPQMSIVSGEERQDPSERFDALLEQLTREGDELRESVQCLLTEGRFDEERMSLGREMLSDLVGKYASNKGEVRRYAGQIDDATYKVLCGLAGKDMRGSNRMPRTLPTILKFERHTSEEEVMTQLARLFEVAIDKGYAAEYPARKFSPTLMPRQVVPPQSVPMEQVVEAEPGKSQIDLFAVAKGEQKVSKSDWSMAVNELFTRLSERDILTGAQSQLLKDRVLLHETDLDDVTRSALNTLQKLSGQPGSRIDEDSEVRDAFNMFTMTAFGANGVEYIAQRLTKAYKKEVKPHTVERRIVGGIAAVTEAGSV